GQRVGVLGFVKDVAEVLAAADLLVSPTRYEPYGLAVHEALCRGLPALTARSAGVAELYPAELSPLLLDDPTDARELADKLLLCQSQWPALRARVHDFGAKLRQRTWRH